MKPQSRLGVGDRGHNQRIPGCYPASFLDIGEEATGRRVFGVVLPPPKSELLNMNLRTKGGPVGHTSESHKSLQNLAANGPRVFPSRLLLLHSGLSSSSHSQCVCQAAAPQALCA